MNPADIDLLAMLKRVRLPTVANVLPRFIALRHPARISGIIRQEYLEFTPGVHPPLGYETSEREHYIASDPEAALANLETDLKELDDLRCVDNRSDAAQAIDLLAELPPLPPTSLPWTDKSPRNMGN